MLPYGAEIQPCSGTGRWRRKICVGAWADFQLHVPGHLILRWKCWAHPVEIGWQGLRGKRESRAGGRETSWCLLTVPNPAPARAEALKYGSWLLSILGTGFGFYRRRSAGNKSLY